MASEDHHAAPPSAAPTLPESTSRKLLSICGLVAVLGLAVGLLFSFFFSSGIEGTLHAGWRRFFLSYLAAYGFVLSIALGSLFFVMLQHVTRSGWSVTVRRVPEAMANTMPVLGILAVPLLATLIFPGSSGDPTLYPWAVGHAEEHVPESIEERSAGPAAEAGEDHAPSEAVDAQADAPVQAAETLTVGHAREHLEYSHLTEQKAPFLNRPFFVLRLLIYFGVWSLIAGFYWRNSVLQDKTGDPALTTKMQKWAPACILAFAATVSLASFDLWKSVDPHFFSTIWPVYIFAGGVIGALSAIILVHLALRNAGHLRDVSREHFHDLGKLLFAFVFFWGYIAFSQFMLIWYANIPETTYWYAVRGATTVASNHGFGAWDYANANAPAPVGWWSLVILVLLFGHLIIPFAGLLSRHVKRNSTALAFWAVWMLVMHYIDQYWLIMPEAMVGGIGIIPLPEIGMLLAMVGGAGAYFVWTLSRVPLRPAADPRLHEALAFHNI